MGRQEGAKLREEERGRVERPPLHCDIVIVWAMVHDGNRGSSSESGQRSYYSQIFVYLLVLFSHAFLTKEVLRSRAYRLFESVGRLSIRSIGVPSGPETLLFGKRHEHC